MERTEKIKYSISGILFLIMVLGYFFNFRIDGRFDGGLYALATWASFGFSAAIIILTKKSNLNIYVWVAVLIFYLDLSLGWILADNRGTDDEYYFHIFYFLILQLSIFGMLYIVGAKLTILPDKLTKYLNLTDVIARHEMIKYSLSFMALILMVVVYYQAFFYNTGYELDTGLGGGMVTIVLFAILIFLNMKTKYRYYVWTSALLFFAAWSSTWLMVNKSLEDYVPYYSPLLYMVMLLLSVIGILYIVASKIKILPKKWIRYVHIINFVILFYVCISLLHYGLTVGLRSEIASLTIYRYWTSTIQVGDNADRYRYRDLNYVHYLSKFIKNNNVKTLVRDLYVFAGIDLDVDRDNSFYTAGWVNAPNISRGKIKALKEKAEKIFDEIGWSPNVYRDIDSEFLFPGSSFYKN